MRKSIPFIVLVLSVFVVVLSAHAAPAATKPQRRIVPSSGLQCIQVNSSGAFNCKDAGNFDSTCATAKCPTGYILTGGGGACNAGNRKIKSLFPKFTAREFVIACEKQGVAPQANAICCKVTK